MSPPASRAESDASPDLPPLDIKRLLREYDIQLKKSLGQNFLVSSSALKKVVAAAGISRGDVVLEVGAGVGVLTRELAARASRVIAVELDDRLMPVLRDVMGPFQNVDLIQGDILEVNLPEALSKPGYLVVANIPYYITSAIIRHLVETDLQPRTLVLTVQKEVAERICAQPGEMSLLALSVQVYGTPQKKEKISADAFYPSPNVDSRVLRVDLYQEPKADRQTLNVFFRLARAGFSQRRKTLRNSLAGGLDWPKEQVEKLCEEGEIDPQRHAETLSVDEWLKLAEIVDVSGGFPVR